MSREMKDSGIEWIGQIPIDWEITKFRNTIERLSTGLNPRDNFTLGTGNNYYVTIRNFENRILNLDERCDKINDDAIALINKRSDLKSGDILFASISKDGQAYLIKENPVNWNINESVFTIRTKKEILNPEYAEYTLVSSYFYNNLLVGATGSTFKSIKIGDLKENTIVLPSINEQRRIADFLNIKSVLIDEIIEKTKATIEEYKLLKQSIITEAVTKGLDKNVEMKDSGIEWIGQVPKDWKITKFGRAIRNTMNGLTRRNQTNENKGTIVLRIRDISNSSIDYSDVNRITLTEKEIVNYSVEEGDILFVRVNGSKKLVGKNAIFHKKSEVVAFNDHIIKIRLNEITNPEYITWVLSSYIGEEQISKYIKTSAGQYTISGEDLKRIVMIFPPFGEQVMISNFLSGKCTEIDNLMSQKQKLLDDMETYKKSLIYEYVTGKKTVE